MAELTAADRATIRAALDVMPPACRYHGTNLESSSPYREECCDTGRPALLRRRALEALERMERAANPPEPAQAPQDGLSRVAEAVRRARGGEAPTTAQGYA